MVDKIKPEEFREYWNSVGNYGILRDAIEEAYNAGFDEAMKKNTDDIKDEWFTKGFEAGVEETKRELQNAVIDACPDVPDADEWAKEKEQENLKASEKKS